MMPDQFFDVVVIEASQVPVMVRDLEALPVYITPTQFPSYHDDQSYSRVIFDTSISAYVVCKGVIYKLTIREGFTTDFASIPRVFTPLFPINGPTKIPAAFHDGLYLTGLVSRLIADRLYAILCAHFKVKAWRISSQYAGLRIGGGKTWDNYRTGDV